MSENLRPQCSQCVFWMPEDPVTVGHCHRYPPQVYFNEHAQLTAQKFPLVDHHHWCGEWSDDDETLKTAAASSLRRSVGEPKRRQ